MSKTPPMTPPSAVLARNGMFAVRDGEAVTRQKTCQCGAEFTQCQMAMSELESLERMGHLATFLKKIPDAFVPVHCPPCERRDLDRQARIDAGYTTTVPDYRRDIA